MATLQVSYVATEGDESIEVVPVSGLSDYWLWMGRIRHNKAPGAVKIGRKWYLPVSTLAQERGVSDAP